MMLRCRKNIIVTNFEGGIEKLMYFSTNVLLDRSIERLGGKFPPDFYLVIVASLPKGSWSTTQ